MRMAGSGGRVLYAFMQKGVKSSEVRLMEKIEGIDVFQVCTITKFTHLLSDSERSEYNRQHKDGWEKILDMADTGQYNMVVVDEMLGALKEGAIGLDDVMEVVLDDNRGYELVFSGREAPVSIIEAADYASRVEEVKHPYTRGIKGRKGIEF